MEDDDELFKIQLEIALEESKKAQDIASSSPPIGLFDLDSETRPIELTSQELAFFTDESLNSMNTNDSKSNQKFIPNSNNFHVRTGYSNMGKPSSINKESGEALPSVLRGSSSSFSLPSSLLSGFRPTETRLLPNNALSNVKSTRSNPPLPVSSTLKEFRCHKCMQKVNGSYIEAIDRYYHKECFKCERCLKLIVQLNAFIPFGTPQEPYHPQCVQDIIDSSCNRQPPEVCFLCKQSLLAGVPLKKALGRSYHPQCFTCYHCKKIIVDQSFAPYGSPEQPYHPQCLQEELNSTDLGKTQPSRPLAAATSCFKCKKSFHLFSGSVVSSALLHDRKYHVSCFCCEACQQQIGQGSYYVVKGDPPQPYHDHCATELFNPRCSICCKAMSGQYYSHMYFKDEIYCKDVAHEQRKSCCSCGRREPFPSAKEVQNVSHCLLYLLIVLLSIFLNRNPRNIQTTLASCRTAEFSAVYV